MVKLSVAIMSHPARDLRARQLSVELGGAPVVQAGGVWDTARAAWAIYDRDATHHLVVQDDAILCADFLDGARAALSVESKVPVSFCAVSKCTLIAKDRWASWVTRTSAGNALALALPTGMIDPWLDWCDTYIKPEYKHDDARLSAWCLVARQLIYHTAPSLVDHDTTVKSLAGNPRFLPGRKARKASWFIGTNVSALTVDWRNGVVRGGGHTLKEYADAFKENV